MLFKLSNLNSNLALTQGYLNPALNNSAQDFTTLRGRSVRKRGGLFVSPLAPLSSSLAVSSALLTYNLNLPFDVFGILAFLMFSLSQKFRYHK